MPRIELSITPDYVPDWDAWCGVREFVQNARDGELEFNAPMRIDWYNGTLRIENDGVTLGHESLLLGHTSKRGRDNMAGGKAEGYKLGTIALLRAGHSVKIRSGGEVWVASIEHSEKFCAKVLAFNIKGGNENKNRIRVEIGGVEKSTWEGMRDRFLFLAHPKKNDRVETSRGDLLLGGYKGKVFVKGIFVQDDSRLSAGYNFRNVETDRDRKMVATHNLEWESSQIWIEAVARRPDLLDPFFQILSDARPDVSSVEYGAGRVTQDVRQKVTAQFAAQFGANAVPVATLAESAEIEHLGRRGIVVSKPLGALLAETLGSKEELQRQLREEVTRVYSWRELSIDQRSNLTDNITLIAQACALSSTTALSLGLVDIVDFRSETLSGQYKDGRTLIAARILDDRDETLATLVHEFCHRLGGDGEKSHGHAVQCLWRDIVKYLRSATSTRSS